MRTERSVCALLPAAAAAAAAQSLPLDEIRARGATALTREEVVELVSGARVTWISVKGERKWTNRPDGSLTVTRIGGPGLQPAPQVRPRQVARPR